MLRQQRIYNRQPTKFRPPAQNPHFRPPPSAPLPSYNTMVERAVARDPLVRNPVVRSQASADDRFEDLMNANKDLQRGIRHYSTRCHQQLLLLAEQKQTIERLEGENAILKLNCRDLQEQNDGLHRILDDVEYRRDQLDAMVTYLTRPNDVEETQALYDALRQDEKNTRRNDNDSNDSYGP